MTVLLIEGFESCTPSITAALVHATPGRTGPAPDPADFAGAADPRRALEQVITGKAVDLVSGPGGLASFLRTRLLGARLAGPSPPLDVGHSAEIPAAIRRAVILRDQHCRWAGGCDQPPRPGRASPRRLDQDNHVVKTATGVARDHR
jgi:hypothetical protein